MKNKLRLISILVIVCLILTGCDGTVTRKIRKDGYTVQDGKFICGFFLNKSKEANTTEKVRYLTDNYIISESGNVYEINYGGLFSNDMNCKKGGTLDGYKVVAIMDQSIVKVSNGDYYYLSSKDEASKYTRVTASDENYQIYKLLMDEENVRKVITVNSSTHSYYILTSDGVIRNRVLYKKENSDNYEKKSETIEVERSTYGSIIDFNYAGDSLATFYKTQDKIITVKVKNSKECNKYVDVPCVYEKTEDQVLNEYKDRIIAFNGNTVITDYGRVFNAGS